jgi:hypothetical protein
MLSIYRIGQTINYNFYSIAEKVGIITGVDFSAGFPIYRVQGEGRPVFRHNINYTVEGKQQFVNKCEIEHSHRHIQYS